MCSSLHGWCLNGAPEFLQWVTYITEPNNVNKKGSSERVKLQKVGLRKWEEQMFAANTLQPSERRRFSCVQNSMGFIQQNAMDRTWALGLSPSWPPAPVWPWKSHVISSRLSFPIWKTTLNLLFWIGKIITINVWVWDTAEFQWQQSITAGAAVDPHHPVRWAEQILHYRHFTEEETEALRGKVTYPLLPLSAKSMKWPLSLICPWRNYLLF